jgi:hypothetical protein
MAELTFQDAYTRATSTNNLYTRNRERWQFLMDSHSGGEDFRNGAYLYRYQLENDSDYQKRLKSTPLDNQCKALISLYVSFLFREAPERLWSAFEVNPVIQDILEDADRDGRSMDAFMKDVAIWASVFGHAWVAISKPDVAAVTLADELSQGVRPYFSVYTPLAVTDWTWSRQANGGYALDMIRVLEEVNDTFTTVKEWSPTEIITTVINTRDARAVDQTVEANGLGYVPFVCAYAERSPVRGIGTSLITDIADQQLMIANELSEIYDSIKLDTHPSLVATESTNVTGAAAGQVITISETLDPALKPFVLQFQGGQIGAIYDSINNRKKMIDTMGNVGSVRATETTSMSGIAIETEFQLLNARLSSIADNLELAEESIWQIVCDYMGMSWDGEIDYPSNFALHNIDNELDQLAKMKGLSVRPEIQQEIDRRLAEILDIEMLEAELGVEVAEGEAPPDFEPHEMTAPDGTVIYIETPAEHDAAVAAGYVE